MKKMITVMLALTLALSLAACGSSASSSTTQSASDTATEAAQEAAEPAAEAAETVSYKIGICNYVDDASLNQIYENIEARLFEIAAEEGVDFDISYQNCQADSNLLNQIISNFIDVEQVDLMIGIATPVAMAMQSATEDTGIPVVFSAVSDPLSAELVDSLEAPGANITGTSDYLDTNTIIELMYALDPDIDMVGLLYDVGQDSSTSAISDAKEAILMKGSAYEVQTGTNVSEIMLAAQSLIASGVDAIFTPSDNTVMTAELSIYEELAEAGIPHYTGADSFALNGAFLGFGVDYANLGRETANIVAEILVEGMDPATVPVMTFDNGIATINTETCEALGYDLESVKAAFEPYCTSIQEIVTAEEF